MASKHKTPTSTEPRTPAMTMQQAKEQLAALGYTITRTGHGAELRVAPKDGTKASREERAYYTDDLADAVGTVKAEQDRLAHRQASFLFVDPKGDLAPSITAPGKAVDAIDPFPAADAPAKTAAAPQRRRRGPGAGI